MPPIMKDEKESQLFSQTEMAGKQGDIIMGKFNYPNIDLANGTAQSMACHFLNVLQDNFTEQMVEVPTRKNDLLDLIIINNFKQHQVYYR